MERFTAFIFVYVSVEVGIIGVGWDKAAIRMTSFLAPISGFTRCKRSGIVGKTIWATNFQCSETDKSFISDILAYLITSQTCLPKNKLNASSCRFRLQ